MADDGDGFKIASAYVEVTTKDNTEAGVAQIRESIQAEPDVEIGTKLGDPDAERTRDAVQAEFEDAPVSIPSTLSDPDAARTREETQAELDADPVNIPVKVDSQGQMRESLGRLVSDADVAGADAGALLGDELGSKSSSGFLSKLPGMFSGAQEAASDAGENMSGALMGKIAAGIVIGGPLLSGAMSAVTVAGLIGIGAVMQKGNPAIQAGWQALVNTAKTEATQASAVMVTPIANALNTIRGNLAAEAPAFQQMFTAAAADIPILTSGLDSLVDNALPGLTNMVENSQPIMQGLASVMGDVGTAVSDIADDVSNNSGVVGSDLSEMGEVAKELGDTLGNLMTIGSDVFNIFGPLLDLFGAGLKVISGGIADVVGWVTHLADSGDQAAPKLSATAQAANALAIDSAKMPPIFQSVTTNADQLTAGITDMSKSTETASGWISQLQTNIKLLSEDGMEKANDEISSFYETLDNLNSSLSSDTGRVLDANGALDLTSQKGRDVQTAIENARNAMVAYTQTATDAGAPTVEITGHMQSMYDALEHELLPAFGDNKQAVDNYLTSLGLVPQQLITDVSAPGAVTSTDQIRGLMQQIQETPTGHTVTVTSLTSTAMANLQNLGLTVKTLPNGTVSIVAQTAQAKQDVNNFIAAEQGRTIFIPIKGVANPATGQPVAGPYHQAIGHLVQANAGGNLDTPTPMSGALAQVVPPGIPRLIGDRLDVPELFAPLDGSARSKALIAQAAQHEGVGLGGTSLQVNNYITQQPQEDGSVLAARVSAETSWAMMQTVGG